MSRKSTFVTLVTNMSLALSGSLLIGGLTACPGSAPGPERFSCTDTPHDPRCPVEVVDMSPPPPPCSPACSGVHMQCNVVSHSCDCDSGYVLQGGVCRTKCDAYPMDPSCQQPQPDLLGAGLHTNQAAVGGNYVLSFPDSSYYLRVKNQGMGSAGAYATAYGLADITDGTVMQCTVPSSGTAAGETSTLSNSATKCNISGSYLKSGHSYALFLCADVNDAVKESDEKNNCSVGPVSTLFAPDTESAASLVAAELSADVMTPAPQLHNWPRLPALGSETVAE